ncbi:hypothetical protein K488DRAFT_82922 [Vararia minispora EC-137]|uniref:Uncharacterized protein n=1 Tax=Vararia minispora EC-137 TaxID=1314806 RepID=A0ACB8QV07_9AGAM|nr:hypothetical protein K488DRAFT_82922 [Vararia minispora EC-137]
MSFTAITSDIISLSSRRFAASSALRAFARRTSLITKPTSNAPPPMELDVDAADGYELSASGELAKCDVSFLPAPIIEPTDASHYAQTIRMRAARPLPPRRRSTSRLGSISPSSSGYRFPDIPSPLSPSNAYKEFRALVEEVKECGVEEEAVTNALEGPRHPSGIAPPKRRARLDIPARAPVIPTVLNIVAPVPRRPAVVPFAHSIASAAAFSQSGIVPSVQSPTLVSPVQPSIPFSVYRAVSASPTNPGSITPATPIPSTPTPLTARHTSLPSSFTSTPADSRCATPITPSRRIVPRTHWVDYKGRPVTASPATARPVAFAAA